MEFTTMSEKKAVFDRLGCKLASERSNGRHLPGVRGSDSIDIIGVDAVDAGVLTFRESDTQDIANQLRDVSRKLFGSPETSARYASRDAEWGFTPN